MLIRDQAGFGMICFDLLLSL